MGSRGSVTRATENMVTSAWLSVSGGWDGATLTSSQEEKVGVISTPSLDH